MQYRNLGSSGLRLSAVGLGGNNIGRPGTVSIDQAGTDAVVDAEIRSPIPAWGARGSRRYIRLAVEGSLRRLNTDWIDLYQLHAPDPATPIEETIDALDGLVTAGKIRYYGSSNLPAWQIAEAHLTATLTGKFTRSEAPADSRIARQRPHILEHAPWDAIEALSALAARRGSTLLRMTVAWFLGRDEVSSVIAGATRPEQVRQNAAATETEPLTAEESAEIGSLFPR